MGLARLIRLDGAGRSWESTRAVFLLMGGRTAGFVAQFVTPIVLARVFDRQEFGTYRQLFLIYSTAWGIAQVGMAESLYYFVPRGAARAGAYVANAVIMLGLIGGACVGGSVAAAPAIARWFRNPALGGLMPLLGVFLALTLLAVSLEIVMVARRQHRAAAATYAGSDALRAALLAAPAALTGRLDLLLAGAIAFGALRCVTLLVYLHRELRGTLRPQLALLPGQLAYALPFAGAVALEAVQQNYHQYAVASWFDPATFAVYSVGCLQVPLVDILATSAANVMMVTMAEQASHGEPALRLWHDTVRRLAFVFVPLVGALVLTAHEVIVTLFTPAYAASAPIFMAFATTFALAALPVDAVLRAHARTRFLLAMNFGKLVFIVGGIGWFVGRWGVEGAVLVTVVALAGAKTAALVRIAQLLRVPVREVLPWRALLWTITAAVAAFLPGLGVRDALRPVAPGLLVAFGAVAAYAGSYLALAAGAWWLRRLAGEDRERVHVASPEAP